MTLNAAPGTTRTITGLVPGTYTVVLEGLVAGQVESYGETAGVVVSAGTNTPVSVTLGSFVPVISAPSVHSFQSPVPIRFDAVQGAIAYQVDVGTDTAFTSNVTTSTVGSNTLDIPVSGRTSFTVRVRSVNRFGGLSRASAHAVVTMDIVLEVSVRQAMALALNGSQQNQLTLAGMQGLITDEFVSASNTAFHGQLDARGTPAGDVQLSWLYSTLQTVRQGARALAVHHGPNASAAPTVAAMRSIEGFAEIWLAESFCSGVTSGDLVNGRMSIGPARPTVQVLQDADAAFTQSLSASATLEARVGRARARLGLGSLSGAAADAAQVPTSFLSVVQPATNGLWQLTNEGRISVADREGSNGIAFRTMNDPRVPWQDAQQAGQDGQTPLFRQLVASQSNSPITLASGIEARLIDAEVALRSGNVQSFLSSHNGLRASRGLQGVSTFPTTDQAVDFHFAERAMWLFSSAHRLGDLRRLVRQYSRSAVSVFPTGQYPKGGSYGSDVNLPIPSAWGTCIDRAA